MDNQYVRKIAEVNYWDKAPSSNRFVRQVYLDKILAYSNTAVLKVLIGQRRCGKSTLLKQTISRLLVEGTPAKNILYLNFELHQLQFIQTQAVLTDVIEAYFKEFKPQGRVTIFLDEIQEVDSWEKTVNSYLANERYEIDFYLTGSNANLLSTELSTYVTGRYIEMAIYPFSYQEYCAYYKLALNRDSYIRFIGDSGLPELFLLPEKSQKIAYLKALQDSILINDVVKRFSIKNPKLLSLLLEFLIDNVGKLFSINAIAKNIRASGVTINIATVANYIRYLELTFLVRCLRRYDLKGKKILEGERKYYLNDLGFSNYLQSSFDNNITRRLENQVYLALLQAGYEVTVGNIYNLEIDFVAEKNNKKIYVQVTYMLHSEEVIKREYGNLEKIKDNWPKWVVSMDDIAFPHKNGIEHVQVWKLYEYLD